MFLFKGLLPLSSKFTLVSILRLGQLHVQAYTGSLGGPSETITITITMSPARPYEAMTLNVELMCSAMSMQSHAHLCWSMKASQKIRMAISRERNEPLKICWCQNNQIFQNFSDFQKLEILDICIFVVFLGRIFSYEKRWCQNDWIF